MAPASRTTSVRRSVNDRQRAPVALYRAVRSAGKSGSKLHNAGEISLTTPGLEINLAWLYASSVVGGILIAVYGFAMMISPLPRGEPPH